MAVPITDNLVVGFSDSRMRPLADLITRTRYAIAAFVADYASAGVGAAITADGNAGVITTNANATDTRPPVTGLQMQNFKAGCDKILANINNDLVAGVGASLASICDAIQVNGSPR